MFLTSPELQQLTGKQRAGAQRRVLDALGVRYGMRADGSLVVLQSAVEAALGAAPTKTKAPEFRMNYVTP